MEQQISKLNLAHTYPPAPKTKRGDFSSLDINNHHFLYFNGPTVILRPINTQEQIKYFIHKSDVSAAKFSNDGKLIASIDEKGTLIIHQLGQKQLFEVKKYQNFYPNAKAIDWSADRKRLCVVGSGKQSFGRVILVEAGTNAGEITGVSSNLTCCSFRPERPYYLVTGGDQFVLKFYQGPPYKFIKSSQKNHSNYINSIKYSPSGKYLISVSSDKKVVIYNGQTLQLIGEKMNCHERSILGADWIDDKLFVTVSADKSIKIWNTQLEQLVLIKCCGQSEFKDNKSFDHFQVAVKYYEGFIYSLSLNGQINKFPLPDLQQIQGSQQKLIEYNVQKVQKYAGWVGKPLNVLSYLHQNQKENKILIVDSSGKVFELKLLEHYSSSNLQLLPFKQQFNSTILHAVQSPKRDSFFILWADGNVSSFQIHDEQLIERQNIKEKNFKLICTPSQELIYDLIAVNNKIYAFNLQNNKVQVSTEIAEDVTSFKVFDKFILIGTIKGNLYIYNGESLQQVAKLQISATKISEIYAERSSKNGHFVIICGDALGKLSISRYDSQKKQFQQLANTLGNHESLITRIVGLDKGETLMTLSMDNKINLWRRVQQGRYSREQDWRHTHQYGIQNGQVIGDRLFTIGGDYLIKQWKITK